jgi:hypothetical protein
MKQPLFVLVLDFEPWIDCHSVPTGHLCQTESTMNNNFKNAMKIRIAPT